MTMLLLLLAVSCGRKEQTGTPYILYEIHGTVTDSDGNPLSGIRVMSGTSEPVYTSEGSDTGGAGWLRCFRPLWKVSSFIVRICSDNLR